MFDTDHPAYSKLAAIGQEITSKVKPSAVVVFSAHWQAGRSHVEVNTGESLPLIYDYYGFPDEYYSVQYPNKGSPELTEKVLGMLKDAGVEAKGVKRGLDHGVFASFKCAFDPERNPLGVPIVQVSLFRTEDGAQHIKLGRALEGLRDEGVVIIVSGMAVHNLRDMRFLMFGETRPLPYTASFDGALKEAVERQPGAERDEAMVKLLKRPDARQAHPSLEHLLPIHIGVGAAGQDVGEQTWTYLEGCMSWAQFRFGTVEA